MNEKIEKLYTLLQTTPLKAKLTLAALLLVVLALPLTVFVSQQQQNLTQQASGACSAGDEHLGADGKIYGCHTVNNSGVWDDQNPNTAISSKGIACPPGKVAVSDPLLNDPKNYSCKSPTTVASANPAVSANPAASTNPTSANNPSSTSTPSQTTTTSTAAEVKTVAGKDNDSCSTTTKPTYQATANGAFSYCLAGKLHVGACSGGNIPQPGAAGSNGITCRTPDYVAAQKPLLSNTNQVDTSKTDQANDSTDPSPSSSPGAGDLSCYDTPGQSCVFQGTCGNSPAGTGNCHLKINGGMVGTCCNTQNTCGGSTQRPDISDRVLAQAQQDYPNKALTNCASTGCNSLTPDQYVAEAKKAGLTDAEIGQSGALGNPYSPSDGNGYAASTNPYMQYYNGCVGVNDNFGTATNMKAFCYKNGQQVGSPLDINGNTDMVSLQASVLGPECVAGGFSSQSVYGTAGMAASMRSYKCDMVKMDAANSVYQWQSLKFKGMLNDFTPDYQPVYTCAQSSTPNLSDPNSFCNNQTGKCTKLADGSTPPADYLSDPGLGATPAPAQKSSTNGNSGQNGSSNASGTGLLSQLLGKGGTQLNLSLKPSPDMGTGTNAIGSKLKQIIVKLKDQNGNIAGSTTANVQYNPSTGLLKSTASFQDLPSGKYSLNVSGQGVTQDSSQLVNTVGDGVVNLASKPITLVGGDTNGDEGIDVLDYNTLISCSTFSKDGGAACKDSQGNSLKPAADLNGDGQVNEDDYTILLRSWKLLNSK